MRKYKPIIVLLVIFIALSLPPSVMAASISISQTGADPNSVMEGIQFTITVSGLSGSGTVSLTDLPSGFSCDEGSPPNYQKSFSSGTPTVSWTTPTITGTKTNQKIKASVQTTGSPEVVETGYFDVKLPPSIVTSHSPSSFSDPSGSQSIQLNVQNWGETTASDVSVVLSLPSGVSLSTGSMSQSISTIEGGPGGSGESVGISWTVSFGTSTSYIYIYITPSNADSETISIPVYVSGDGGGPGGPGGPAVPGTGDGEEGEEEGEKETRKPELIPGVGLRNNTKLQAAIEKVLGIANMSEQARENLLRISSSISSQVQMEREINVAGGKSTLTTRMKYLEDKVAKNFMFYDSVPKTFAASASNITVTAPGASYEVVEEDPSFVFLYPELSFGEEVTVSYEVSEEVETSVIDSFSGEVYAEGVEEFVCDIGQRRCVESDVEECNSNRTGWVFVETCSYGCLSGACLPSPTEISEWLLWIVVIIVIVVVVVLAGFAVSRRKKESRPKFKSEIPEGAPSSPESEDISRF